MNPQETLRALGDLMGILPAFHGFDGHERITSDDTYRAMLAANGVDVASDAAVAEALDSLRATTHGRWFPVSFVVVSDSTSDLPFGLGAQWQVAIWGQGDFICEGQAGDHIVLPALAPDVYDLRIAVAGRVEHVQILAAPARLPMLPDLSPGLRPWGVTAALYGLQSERGTGLGDFADLGLLAETLGHVGAGFVGVNPVHAMGYAETEAISPYSPSHRGFYNIGHIALDAIPGLEASAGARKLKAQIVQEFGPIKSSETVAYGPHRRAHKAMLENLYQVFEQEASPRARAELTAFVAAGGSALERFARYEVLAETHGGDWRQWPVKSELPAPTDRMQYHCWLQWVADSQLAHAQSRAHHAGMPLGLYLDLSVGARRDGAESWCEQDSIATGVSIGAPPDQLGPEGQNWDLAAFAPRKLQATGYAALRLVLAQTMRHAGVIRIDHVLGLNRSFWVPDDGSAGAYIRQPFEALLAIIKIEASRAGCIVIGEDLGLVPDGFRETMRSHGFYGYSVLQYEKDEAGRFRDPAHGPAQVLSCFGTHDTPTIRGFETVRDIDLWEQLDLIGNDAAVHARETRKRDVEGLAAIAPVEDGDLVDSVHGALAGAAADMICVQLDDILRQAEPQNLPGTTDEHPNWRRRHPIAVEALATHKNLTELSATMARRGRASGLIAESEDTHEH